MPIYHIKNGEELREIICSWDELQEILRESPEWKQILSAPRIVGGIHTTVVSKTDDGWKDVLKKIKSGSGRGNTINT